MKRKFTFESLCLSIYLGTASVYWLPGVSLSAVDGVKKAVFLIGVGLLLFRLMAENKFYIPRGLWGLMGFLGLIILSIPGLVQSTGVIIVFRSVLDIMVGATFLWCFFNLTLHGADIGLIFHRTAIIISSFSAFTVANFLTGIPHWKAPIAYDSEPLNVVGFGAASTGWSNGLALCFPILVFVISKAKFPQKIIWIAMLGCVLGSQIASGGRAGILASLIGASLFILAKGKFIVFLSCMIITALIFYISHEFWIDHLRISRLHSMSISHLDHFSAGRIKSYIIAIEEIQKQPLFGNGIGHLMVYKSDKELLEIHNLWLRLMVEYGILMPLFFLVMIGVVLHCAIQILTKCKTTAMNRELVIASSIIVISGIIISLFEPRALIGSFQIGAIWWAAIGIILGSYISNFYRGNTL